MNTFHTILKISNPKIQELNEKADKMNKDTLLHYSNILAESSNLEEKI